MVYAYTQPSWNANRIFGFFVALSINVLLLYGLATALVFDPTIDHSGGVIYVPVPEDPQKPMPPPEDPVAWQPGPVPMDPLGLPPDHVIHIPQQPVLTSPLDVGAGSTGETGSGPVISELQVDPAYFVAPNYPPRSVALDEEGTVQLLIFVTPDGRVGDVRVSRSSGYPRLDNAAMRTARMKWRFRPRTQDGVPVGAWGTYAVRFELKQDSR
jgi:protein TonB